MGNYPWNKKTRQQYIGLQESLSKTTNCYRARAIEETLNSFVEKISKGETLTDNQIKNMLHDRWRKGRNRELLIAKQKPAESCESGVEAIITISQLSRNFPKRDFKLIIGKAQGYTVKELAVSSNGLSEEAIKKRISRARNKIVRMAA